MKPRNQGNGAVMGAKKWAVLAVALATVAPLWAQRGPGNALGGPNRNGQCVFAGDTTALGALTQDETKWVGFMREEEKLARDVYLTLYAKHKLAVFDNIADSEQRHFDALGRVIARYGLADPVKSDEVGAFTEPELASLYQKLITDGAASEEAALRVGAAIEELDIRDLDAAIKATDNADILRVYGNLRRGSTNHLRAFVARLQALELTYEAKYLDPAALKVILNSPWERGNGRRGGRGQGQGICWRQ